MYSGFEGTGRGHNKLCRPLSLTSLFTDTRNRFTYGRRAPLSCLWSGVRSALESHGAAIVPTWPVASRLDSTEIVVARMWSRVSVGISTILRRCSGDGSGPPAVEILGKDLIPCSTSHSANRWKVVGGGLRREQGVSASVTGKGRLRSRSLWMPAVG